jgi:hypothetical protein
MCVARRWRGFGRRGKKSLGCHTFGFVDKLEGFDPREWRALTGQASAPASPLPPSLGAERGAALPEGLPPLDSHAAAVLAAVLATAGRRPRRQRRA